jgi:hypothetical protein
MPLSEDLGRTLFYYLGRAFRFRIDRQIARFVRLCDDPEAVQTALLQKIVRTQANTAFGRDHHFHEIRTIADYRRNVPVAPYERMQPYIDRVAAGETDALLANGPVRLLALTSGTTAARKLIPVTDDSLAAYRLAWNMWGGKMYPDNKPRQLFARPIVQLVGDPVEYHSPGGVPCGNMSGYTATVQSRIVRKMFAVPYQVGTVKDAGAKFYTAVRLAVGRPCSVFFAANPSTLLQFGRTLEANAESLLRDLHNGTLNADLDLPGDVRAAVASRLKANPARSRELAKIADREGTLLPKHVWPPETILIGCWTGGSMGPYLRQLPKYFGEPAIRDLGLIASEGRFTIPFENGTASGVLEILANYYEFIPESEIDSPQPTVLGAHELKLGGTYYILPTTQAGLYRYHISDVVRVTGFLGRTPKIEFLSKGSRFANLTGEKLSEHHVTRAFDKASAAAGYHLQAAYSVAPVWDDRLPYYGLYVERGDANPPAGFLDAFDRELGTNNIEYASKRQSGRLGPVQLRVLVPGYWENWDRIAVAARGGSPEQYKHPCLIGDLDFEKKANAA